MASSNAAPGTRRRASHQASGVHSNNRIAVVTRASLIPTQSANQSPLLSMDHPVARGLNLLLRSRRKQKVIELRRVRRIVQQPALLQNRGIQ